MLSPRAMAPLWIIAISLVVMALWLTGIPTIAITAITLANQAPAATPRPAPTRVPVPTPTQHLCTQVARVDYHQWSRHWELYEGTLLYYRGKVVRPDVIHDEGLLLIDVLPSPSGQSLGRGLVWLRDAARAQAVAHDLVEVIGHAAAPVRTLGQKTLPSLRVVALQNMEVGWRRCATPVS